MGFKFRPSRRSIKIAPGVRVNTSSKGLSSVSVGGHKNGLGATANLNLNTGKSKTTASIAGLGSVESETGLASRKSDLEVLPDLEQAKINCDRSWYQQTWLIILLMVFVPPVSIPLIWLSQWSSSRKAIATGSTLVWLACLIPLA